MRNAFVTRLLVGNRPFPMILSPLIRLSGHSRSQETKWCSVFHLLISHPASLFVVRTKSKVLLQRRYSHAVDKSTGVRSDQTVILSSFESASAYPDPLRRVRYFDADTGKRLKFLTHNFTLPALTIARIYKQRWQGELFFESSTWCTPSDVMEFQEPIALNRPLVGSPDDFVRPCIARRLLGG
jgi:hypothetical protein